VQRAADYLAVEPQAAVPQPAAAHGLTAADLVAARQREPAAITRVYTAYAPALFRFFAPRWATASRPRTSPAVSS
jgi:hypothetical protein